VDASLVRAFSLSAGYHKQDEVMPIARNEVTSSPDNPASRLKLLPCQAVVEKTLEIKGGNIQALRVIRPCLAAELRPVVRRHCCLPPYDQISQKESRPFYGAFAEL